MNPLDPRLLRLREIEARLAFAEYHINDQRALVARLTRLGLDNSLAHSLLRSMEDSMAILRLRQRDILSALEPSEAPQPPTASTVPPLTAGAADSAVLIRPSPSPRAPRQRWSAAA